MIPSNHGRISYRRQFRSKIGIFTVYLIPSLVNSHRHFAMAMVRYGAQKVELCSYHNVNKYVSCHLLIVWLTETIYKHIASYQCVMWAGQKGSVAALATAQTGKQTAHYNNQHKLRKMDNAGQWQLQAFADRCTKANPSSTSPEQ